jgi:hypothetical protein
MLKYNDEPFDHHSNLSLIFVQITETVRTRSITSSVSKYHLRRRSSKKSKGKRSLYAHSHSKRHIKNHVNTSDELNDELFI